MGGMRPSPFFLQPMRSPPIARFLVYTDRSLSSSSLAQVSVSAAGDFNMPEEVAAMISVKRSMLTVNTAEMVVELVCMSPPNHCLNICLCLPGLRNCKRAGIGHLPGKGPLEE